MNYNKMLENLKDIQETLEYEIVKFGRWDDVPKDMQLDIKEAISDLRTTVFAALGYVIIHGNTN